MFLYTGFVYQIQYREQSLYFSNCILFYLRFLHANRISQSSSIPAAYFPLDVTKSLFKSFIIILVTAANGDVTKRGL